MTRTRVGYREQSQHGARQPRGRLRYSDLEWATIVTAAALDGMAPNA